MTPGQVNYDRFFKNLPLKNWIFENLENPQHFFYKIHEFFVCFWFSMYTNIRIDLIMLRYPVVVIPCRYNYILASNLKVLQTNM